MHTLPDGFTPTGPLTSSVCLRRATQASDDGDTMTCASGTNACGDGTNSSSSNSPNAKGHIDWTRFVNQAQRLSWRPPSRSKVQRRPRIRACRRIRRIAPNRAGISIRRRGPRNARLLCDVHGRPGECGIQGFDHRDCHPCRLGGLGETTSESQVPSTFAFAAANSASVSAPLLCSPASR